MSSLALRPRVPPKGSRELRPRGELGFAKTSTTSSTRVSSVEVHVAEVTTKQAQAAELVRSKDLRGALALFSECQEDTTDALNGLQKDDPNYLTLIEMQRSLAEKIHKLREFLPNEYFLQPVRR
eukprot:TRINITY_DN6898_c0_g1_i1.p1 TRINITY_DN6898_c0_g1~~TRINITY_DN6898_c0_g1_i1.p1  ORF type:complete len:132 (+),score=19.72 TRINITY_DN6898_c0_g1_i1:25-396(+)